MTIKDFSQLYLAELDELRSVEAQMAEHLDRLAAQATDPNLSREIETHHARTEAHRDRLTHRCDIIETGNKSWRLRNRD